MSAEDADAFDAVMLDIMGALIALPVVGVAHSGDPTRITPRMPRYDRIPQIAPDLLALGKFFGRLQEAGLPASNGRMFARARKDAQKMLAALPCPKTFSAPPGRRSASPLPNPAYFHRHG